MAKITELVKTYKLLNDPNAPDWNIRFVGGAVIALAVIAAAGALLWSSGNASDPETTPVSAVSDEDAAPGSEDCQPLAEGVEVSATPAGAAPEDPCVTPLP